MKRIVCAILLLAFQVSARAEIDCHAFFSDGFEETDQPTTSRLRCTDAPPLTLLTVGTTFAPTDGDLDVSIVTADGDCIAGRLGDECIWADRTFETGEELLSVLNVADSDHTVYWRASPVGNESPPFITVETIRLFIDGPDCTDNFSPAECISWPNGVLSLLQFPVADSSDPFIADGLRPQNPANYRWGRRELLMLVRYAMHETQRKFAGTLPLGVGDISQRGGEIPGTDIASPRHPAGTHLQGSDVDLAYFHTLAATGQVPFNDIRTICDANGGNHGDLTCNPGASSTHIVDLPRQVYFLAKLVTSDRVRVVGVDEVIGPLLLAEADVQRGIGNITEEEHDALFAKVAYNTAHGWVLLFRFLHLSLHSEP